MLTDAHCHLQADEFDADRDDVLARCRDRGMTCIVVGNHLEDSERAAALAAEHDFLYAVVGLHPMYMDEESWDRTAYERLMHQPRVVGVGEIGLDYYRIWADTPEDEARVRRAQQALFQEQLHLAADLQRPVVVHCRDAYSDVLAILKTVSVPSIMIHTFLGDPKTAEQFLELGAVLSFSGIVTFGKDESLKETIRSVPLTSMTIETDAPYLTPVPNRGRRNEPIFVEETAKVIAVIKGITAETVIRQTGENTRSFFHLPEITSITG